MTALPTRPPACTQIARTLREPLRGTAARAAGWLLIEQTGPWSRDAFTHSVFAQEVVEELKVRCRAAAIRPQLIRPTVRKPADDKAITVFLAHSGRKGPWLRSRTLADPLDVLSLDIEAAASPVPVAGWNAVEAALYLVCTHGKKDACCAVFGKRVTRALRDRGDRAWESTHLGGDRFAAGVVGLPEGIYYGHVDAATAPELLDEHDGGDIRLDLYRGRCVDEPVEQAADALVREHLGLTGITDVTPHPATFLGNDIFVVVDTAHRRYRVQLASAPAPSRLTSCTTPTTARPEHYRLVDVTEVR